MRRVATGNLINRLVGAVAALAAAPARQRVQPAGWDVGSPEPSAAALLAPVLWCGIEYFRSEVWWLRFAWFGAGSVFDSSLLALVGWLGVYGLGCITQTSGTKGGERGSFIALSIIH